MIERGKNYTAAELKAMLGDDWQQKAGIFTMRVVQNKPVIHTFEDFDQDTKQIYATIKSMIHQKNPGKEIKVWASGSRVKGTWRTKEETEAGQIKKYSDYDYCTDAQFIPNKEEFKQVLNVPVDLAGCEGHKVLIES